MRATSKAVAPSVPPEFVQSGVTTAEIPVVGTTRAMAAVGAFASSSTRQVLRPHPDPAPVGIRLLVWTLVFIFIVLAVGLLAEYMHPTWLSFFRYTTKTPHALAAVRGRFLTL